MDLLFVYGTLRSEFDNEHARLLRSSAERIGPMTVEGSIYRVDFYPAYRRHPSGQVLGELYRLRDAATTLAALDAYEGEDFERVKTVTPHGEAWIYQYRREPAAETRIVSGDFCAQ